MVARHGESEIWSRDTRYCIFVLRFGLLRFDGRCSIARLPPRAFSNARQIVVEGISGLELLVLVIGKLVENDFGDSTWLLYDTIAAVSRIQHHPHPLLSHRVQSMEKLVQPIVNGFGEAPFTIASIAALQKKKFAAAFEPFLRPS